VGWTREAKIGDWRKKLDGSDYRYLSGNEGRHGQGVDVSRGRGVKESEMDGGWVYG